MAADIPEGLHKLKLGRSFDKKSGELYHTVRYDFKPASLDECKESYVDFGPKSETIISIPKIDSSGDVKDLTLFKGSRKSHQKECLLIYDHETGEFTLEDLTYSVQVKQVRSGEEEKEKNLQYVRNIRNKFKSRSPFDNSTLSPRPPSAVAPAVSLNNQNSSSSAGGGGGDLLMSDNDDDDEGSGNSSSSSSEDDNEEGAGVDDAVKPKKAGARQPKLDDSRDEEESDGETANEDSGSEEDDIAKSLEAVVATGSANAKSVHVATGPASFKANTATTAKSNDNTLHNDLHLSDTSDDD